MKTWLQLKTEIRNQIWSSGEAENLVNAHDLLFQEAAADISKWVICEQEDNVNIVEFCFTFFKCGMTVLPAPKGMISRVFTVANNEYCDPVTYRQVDISVVECHARNFVSAPVSAAVPSVRLPLGFQPADASTNAKCGRARTGVWAIHKGNIHMFPWIQSNEFVAIEWTGIKIEWNDSDLINPAQDYKKAVKLYMQYAHERDYGSMERMAVFLVRRPGQPDTGLYADALAELIYQCQEEIKVRETKTCGNERPRLMSEIADDVVPDPASPLVVAQVANFSDNDANAQLVAALVSSLEPTVVVTAGNNAIGEYAPSVGTLYGSFIEAENFWPVPGETDWRGAYYGLGAVYLTFSNGSTGDFNHIYYNSISLANVEYTVSGLAAFLTATADAINGSGTGFTAAVVAGKLVVIPPSPSTDLSTDGLFSATTDGTLLVELSPPEAPTLDEYKAFFDLPNNERYYDVCLANVHFFFLDSDANEPDGISGSSDQAVWLRSKLMLSTAPWKIVVLHGAPYSSTLANATLQWAFASWGANMVISGGPKNYERLNIGGVPFINNGLGGDGAIVPIVSPVVESQFQYSAQFGAGRITASATNLRYEFVNLAQEVVDIIELTK